MKRTAIAVLACCVLAFALAGCAAQGNGSASSASASKATDAESLKGFWELESSDAMGFDASLMLADQNMAELVLQDTFMDGTWTADGTSASVKFSDGPTVSLYVQGDKLVYGTDDGSRLVFARSNVDEVDEGVAVEGVDEGDGELQPVSSGSSSSSGSAEVSEGDFEDIELVEEKIDDIEPVTVTDKDGITIKVTGKGTDFTGDPCYRLIIQNDTKKAVFLVPKDSFTVDGKSVEAGLGEVVDPGEEVEGSLYFSADDVAGVDKLVKVEGEITISDDDTSQEITTVKFKMD